MRPCQRVTSSLPSVVKHKLCGAPCSGIMCSDPQVCTTRSLFIDDLIMTMNTNAFLYEELKYTLDDQIKIFTNSKARFSMLLSIWQLTERTCTQRLSRRRKEEVEKEYKASGRLGCERIKWIMFHACALIVVHNAMVETSAGCPGNQIVDCDDASPRSSTSHRHH